MVTNFISSFRDILFHILKNDKTLNQIQSDLHLLLEQINNHKNNNNTVVDSFVNLDPHSLIKALEYNNALLFSTIRPDNIKYFLNSALTEGRYYFVAMVCDILLNSKIKKELKEEIQTIYNESSLNYKLPLFFKEKSIEDIIENISKDILDICLTHSNWREISIKVIKEKMDFALDKFSIIDSKLSELILNELYIHFSKN